MQKVVVGHLLCLPLIALHCPFLSFAATSMDRPCIKLQGAVAEWLGRGLQNLLQRFESAQRLWFSWQLASAMKSAVLMAAGLYLDQRPLGRIMEMRVPFVQFSLKGGTLAVGEAEALNDIKQRRNCVMRPSRSVVTCIEPNLAR